MNLIDEGFDIMDAESNFVDELPTLIELTPETRIEFERRETKNIQWKLQNHQNEESQQNVTEETLLPPRRLHAFLMGGDFEYFKELMIFFAW